MYVLIKRRCEDCRGSIGLSSRRSACAFLKVSLGGSVPHIWELMLGIVMTWSCVTLGLVFSPGMASAWPGLAA